MSQYATADEEVAQLKSIVKEYGPALLLGLVIALGGSFGYKAWQSNQQQTRENASMLYAQVVELSLSQEPGQALSDDMRSHLLAVSGELKENYAKTTYASYAALFNAKQALADGEGSIAESELNWVIAAQQDSDIADLARVRLARLLMQDAERLAEAKALLSATKTSSFQLSVLAALGDLYRAEGELSAARDAYQQALDIAREQGSALPLVQLKLDDLATVVDEV